MIKLKFLWTILWSLFFYSTWQTSGQSCRNNDICCGWISPTESQFWKEAAIMPGRFLLQHIRGEQQESQGKSDPPCRPPGSSESYWKCRCCFKPSFRIIGVRPRFIYFKKFNEFLICRWGLRITGLTNYLVLCHQSYESSVHRSLLPGSVSPASPSGCHPSRLRPRAALLGSGEATFKRWSVFTMFT